MAGGDRSLEVTPTWSVALVCTVFVFVSFIGERILHYLSHWLSRTKRRPLYEALEKMKEELMLLGFISILITVTAPYIAKICVRTVSYEKNFMPCRDKKVEKESESKHHLTVNKRVLAELGNTCKGEGQEPFISFLSIEQLHRFIFVMGCTHVVYTCLTMLLAIVKVYSWRSWEHEAFEHEEKKANMADLCRTLTTKRQSTFVAHHTASPGSKNRLALWLICFFRQFGQCVTKSDYLALRLGFITKHGLPPQYDFHSYMVRSMEDEFKDIVGISPLFWMFVIMFMLFNTEGTNLYFWIAFLPVVLVLAAGVKLQKVIAQLALENSGSSGPLTGIHLAPRDSLFWFRRPRLMLYLIHFILFQNAFEIATFFWVLWQFGWQSCFISKKGLVYARLISGILVQILCSYSTLPLYALVTQMGSHYKTAIFKSSVVESLHKWKRDARRRVKQSGSVESGGGSPTVHIPEDEEEDEDDVEEIDLEESTHNGSAGNARELNRSASSLTSPRDTPLVREVAKSANHFR